MAVVARLRRAQPRNADTMLVCDELERSLLRVSTAPANNVSKPAKAPANTDRKAYMRDLMRKKRAAAREAAGGT
jgi:hypothetical protein